MSVNVRDKVADIGRGYFVPASGNRVQPEELAELLSKAHFTGKADRPLVLMLYDSFYATAQALDMALVDAGLDVAQSKPGKKAKPGRSAIGQVRAELKNKIAALISPRDDKMAEKSDRNANNTNRSLGEPSLTLMV